MTPMIGEMQRTTGRVELIEADLTGEIIGGCRFCASGTRAGFARIDL
jgi:hypothetical protein